MNMERFFENCQAYFYLNLLLLPPPLCVWVCNILFFFYGSLIRMHTAFS